MGLLDGLLGGNSQSPLESIVMNMLTNSGGGQAQSQGSQGGLLGGLLGAVGGGGAAGGGLQSLLSAFEQNGMGQIAQSWVGNGANQPVSPSQVQQVFGDDQVQSMADKTGMPKQDLLSELSRILPSMVDRMTPNGQVPTANT